MKSDQLHIESIPPLRGTAAQLLKLATDSDVGVDELAMVIERDPPLSARLLGIANSAYYAPRRAVMRVHDAIVRVLGLNLVRNIALGVAITGGLSTLTCRHFDLARYWSMALGSADLSAALIRSADFANDADPDLAYQLGLLHNLGELLLAYLFPAAMDQALVLAKRDPELGQVGAEVQLFGVDHWQAGEMLARHWGLPPTLADNLGGFGRDADANDCVELAVARAAQHWVSAAFDGHVDDLNVPGINAATCTARANAFLDRLDDLRRLARAMC